MWIMMRITLLIGLKFLVIFHYSYVVVMGGGVVVVVVVLDYHDP